MFNQSPEVKRFIEEIIEVCKKHGYSISHEDSQGAFEIKPYNEQDVEWFKDAMDRTRPSR